MMKKIFNNTKSVQSIHPCQSVIQTIYDIVNAHGGELTVESETGAGAIFTKNLPL
jgi:K+-sensing histidine kinase KdpD